MTPERTISSPAARLWRDCAVALALVALATLLRAVMNPILGDRLPYPTYFAAVAAAAWFGRIPAGVALFAGLAVAWYAFLAPQYAFALPNAVSGFGMLLYLVFGTAIAAVVDALRRARVRAEGEAAARRTAEAALREERDRFAVTLHSIGDAVVVTDATGRIETMNPVAESLTGWTLAEARGRPFADVLVLLNEPTRGPAENPIARVLRHGRVAGLANHTILVNRHGGEYPIDDSAAPIRNESGVVHGVVMVFRDVSAQRRALARLEESEARFRAMADGAPALIWTSDLGRGRTYFNRGWLAFTGRALEAELGEGWAERVHPEDRDRCRAVQAAALAEHRPFATEFRLLRADGEYRWLAEHAVPRLGLGGQLEGYVGACMDITARRAAEQAVAEADRRKTEFLAILSHELRNPLASIMNAAQVLRLLGGEADPELARARAVIERQSRHLARIVDDLLDVARITSGKIALRRERVPLRAAIERAVELVQERVQAKGQSLQTAIAGEDLYVAGDLTRLVQAFGNLLHNASKYTPVGGRIALRAAASGGSAVVSVTDDGRGIAAAELPHVFDLFRQGAADADRSEGGMGIGLTLVRHIAELHGGSVTAASPGQGKGSTFVVRLPLEGADAERPVRAGDAPGATAGLRVLVVDDNADAAEMLGAGLSLQGHDVRIALSAVEALRTGAAFRPEVALLDLGLPGLDGFALVERLRAQAWGAGTVLIAVTGYGLPEDRARTAAAGFAHHVVKPVDLDALGDLLRSLARPVAAGSG